VLALTRPVPRSISRCELTHLARVPIDYARASAEHDAYEHTLAALGCDVRRLPAADDLPDSVFVEDTAVVLDRIAVLARPGASSRRPEVESVRAALAPYRELVSIEAPGTLDGGDVLRIGQTLYVGLTPRTNADGARQLAAAAAREGIEVVTATVTGCLHLKSAATLVSAAPPIVLVNPGWMDSALFRGCEVIPVDEDEPYAANALLVGGTVVCAAEFPRTRARLEARGLATAAVPAGELAKAEGGLTCGSILFEVSGPA
jgi:dimethylargininase